MNETGTVESVKDGEVLVRLKRHGACLGCRACSLSSAGDMMVKARSLGIVNPGDQVTVKIETAKVIKAIVLIYLFPALSFILGIVIGFYTLPLMGVVRNIELISLAIGLAFIIFAYSIARIYGSRRGKEYQAEVKSVSK
ncbi:MAG: SoxR reducing system RseC family protein [Candidatus Omnitrophica bacterium]|nr:SoxR reducing system RseC family protein [Candidatus Omnitrophota bacterium]